MVNFIRFASASQAQASASHLLHFRRAALYFLAFSSPLWYPRPMARKPILSLDEHRHLAAFLDTTMRAARKQSVYLNARVPKPPPYLTRRFAAIIQELSRIERVATTDFLRYEPNERGPNLYWGCAPSPESPTPPHTEPTATSPHK